MRIISGELRGRKLLSPDSDKVRPTTDKVKEAVFNILAPYLEDAVVIDLFAGTGSLGLEALSRGAVRVYFVDKSKESINLVKENVKRCAAEDRSVILLYDFERGLERIPEKVDIIFLDPPYSKGFMEKSLSLISASMRLNEDGIVVAEHGKDEILPDRIGNLTKIKEKKYGKIMISIYSYGSEGNLA
jgi:16S rRNA (guanine966-N2)-methyltransferase